MPDEVNVTETQLSHERNASWAAARKMEWKRQHQWQANAELRWWCEPEVCWSSPEEEPMDVTTLWPSNGGWTCGRSALDRHGLRSWSTSWPRTPQRVRLVQHWAMASTVSYCSCRDYRPVLWQMGECSDFRQIARCSVPWCLCPWKVLPVELTSA